MGKITELYDYLNRSPKDFRGLTHQQFSRFYYAHLEHTPELKSLRNELKWYKICNNIDTLINLDDTIEAIQ